MKLRMIILALIVLPMVLSGCWDYEEYEDMVQVSAIGIDFNKESNEISLSVQYIPTTKIDGGTEASGSASKKAIVHSTTAKTVYEALSKVQEVVFKKLFFGYIKVIIIGKDAAKYQMLDIVEFLDRSPVIRSTSYLVITSGKAEDTISTVDASAVGSFSEEIYNLIGLTNNTGAAYPVSVHEFTSMLAIPGIEATAPRVVSVSNFSQTEAKGGSEDQIRYDQERIGDQRIAGIAAFNKAKFVGWLNEKESLGLGLITGKNILAYKVSEVADSVNREQIFYYRLNKSKGKIKVQLVNDKPLFQVDIKIVANLMKYYGNKGSQFLAPKEIKNLEKKLADSIRSDIQVALKRGQKELRTDIFGFGFALFREEPKLWRAKYENKWKDIFPTIPVQINVQTKVINTGTNIRKLEVK